MFNLNKEQKEFATMVLGLSFRQVLLTGEAGTGKTYTLTKALSQLHRDGVRVLMCAPTHLAKNTLVEKLDEDVREFVETKTVASLLSQFGFLNVYGETNFKAPEPKNFSHKWDVIAIDECSMISEAAYQALKSCGCKVIYTGDFAQLPVVMSKKSTMLDDKDLQHVHLTQQMRQQGVVHQIAERNRKEMFIPTESAECDQTALHVHTSLNKMLARYVGNLMEDDRGMDSPAFHRFISFRNDTCEFVNNFVRAEFLETEEPFIEDESILICYTTPVAANGEVVKISDVQQETASLELYNHKWRSYQVQITTKRGSCYVRMIPPADKKLVDERKQQLTDIMKIAIRTSNKAAYKEAFDEKKYIMDIWTEVKYPYAVTAHKSQGQTIENVYVNTQELSKAPNKRALTYVAFSRAAKELHTVRI